MTDRSNQSEKQESSSSEQKEFATRRTVIQGLASVAPVIMTLSSGEALASSSNLQCVKEPPDDLKKCLKKDKHTGLFPQDGWLRKKKKVKCKGHIKEKKCLVYVDMDGSKSTDKNHGMPMKKSCYNSFIGKLDPKK
jgi:hypothetical protein